MLKILIVITRGIVGGASMSILNLAKELKARRIDVCVGFGEGNFLKQELKKNNINFHQFKWLKRTHNPFANLLFILEIKNFLNKNHFTAAHFNSSNALFGAMGAKLSRFKPKTIFTIHGLSVLDPNYQKNKILKPIYYWFFKLLFCFIDTIVFISFFNLEIAKKIKLIKKAVVVYNGIEPNELKFLPREKAKSFFQEKLNPAPSIGALSPVGKFSLTIHPRNRTTGHPERCWINANLDNTGLMPFIIGSIGRLDYAKNYEFLINVFSKILKIKNNAICLIIGEGMERKKYQKLIKKLNLENKIFLIGEIKNAAQYTKAFDLFVLPSRYEGLSITLMETLFAGVPILTTNVGGNAEIVANSFQQLYELNNQTDFLKKFKNLIFNPHFCQKIVEQNKISAQQFLIKKTVDKYLKIYYQAKREKSKNEVFIFPSEHR